LRILVIEDEKEIADGIQAILKRDGYESDAVYDGDTGLDYIRTSVYDLILLDIMLPGMNGMDVLKAAKDEKINTPVILLTARSMVDDKIKGLDLGADDYLTKPFDSRELLARIRARLRSNDTASGIMNGHTLSVYDITLDQTTYKLAHGEKSVKLSNKEYQFMEYLMRNKGIILQHDSIAAKVWGFDEDTDYNNIAVYVSFLRKKLKFIGAKTAIVTKKDIGYSIEENDGK
jgi:DNA-binding response OmpR family regulator